MASASLLLLLLAASWAPVRAWKASAAGPNGAPAAWAHRMRLDANYDVLWTASETDITFEVQARTLGYVIFGLSPSGLFHDADLVVGWLQNGRPRFQVNQAFPMNGRLILINRASESKSSLLKRPASVPCDLIH